MNGIRMRHFGSLATLFAAAAMMVFSGCATPDGKQSAKRRPTRSHATQASMPMWKSESMTPSSNPTSADGRGEPSLDEFDRLAAWIYVDGQGGHFLRKDGKPDVPWTIEAPISTSPTFRVTVYEPLLGTPKEFNCFVRSVGSIDGAEIRYTFEADAGTFVVGRSYSLLNPGSGFTVRNSVTGDVVSEIPTLLPGTYEMWAGVKNADTGKEALAVSNFTVHGGR